MKRDLRAKERVLIRLYSYAPLEVKRDLIPKCLILQPYFIRVPNLKVSETVRYCNFYWFYFSDCFDVVLLLRMRFVSF